jgi:hypothetical protein
MQTLPNNTVSKLSYFDKRIKSFYQKQGFINLPLDESKMPPLIESINDDLSALFLKIWGSSMGAHLLDKFYAYRGNILEFYLCLDAKNRELFSAIDW